MNQRTGQSGLTIHATILVLGLIVLGGGKLACAQGVATGGTAVPARPLPPGMKAPTVTFSRSLLASRVLKSPGQTWKTIHR